jgi:hypothetical protein
MINQQQRNQAANELLALVDNAKFNEKDKNRIKNMIGFNHEVLSLGALQERNNQLGVLSNQLGVLSPPK